MKDPQLEIADLNGSCALKGRLTTCSLFSNSEMGWRLRMERRAMHAKKMEMQRRIEADLRALVGPDCQFSPRASAAIASIATTSSRKAKKLQKTFECEVPKGVDRKNALDADHPCIHDESAVYRHPPESKQVKQTLTRSSNTCRSGTAEADSHDLSSEDDDDVTVTDMFTVTVATPRDAFTSKVAPMKPNFILMLMFLLDSFAWGDGIIECSTYIAGHVALSQND